jgi:putative PIN family toxin of toxin-antitoxin system
VLDTNVVLSALVFTQGRLAAVRLAWQAGHCVPLLSRTTAGELLRTLAYPKFKLGAEAQRELLADYLPYCTTVRLPARAPKLPACRDPFDMAFLELALAGRADYLVTGDRDLLSLTIGLPCPVVTPDAFLAALAGA